MGFDLRILGRFEATEELEALDQTEGRWILCSRDFARGTEKLVYAFAGQNTSQPMIYGAYPAENLVDGNRLTMLRNDLSRTVGTDPSYLWLYFDTGTSERKALVFLEWPEDEPAAIYAAGLSNNAASLDDVDNLLNPVTATELYCGRRWGLWSLEYDAYSESLSQIVKVVDSAVELELKDAMTVGAWIGAICVPQTGLNAGIGRRVISNTATHVIVDRPWPQEMVGDAVIPYTSPPGDTVLLRKYLPNYLNSRYMRLQLVSKYHPTRAPERLIGVSVCDFYMELKGDKANFRRHRAPNPVSLSKGSNPTGVVHVGLRGALIEQTGGPKERISAEFLAYNMFPEDLMGWASRGIVGLVDENHRYLQCYIEPGSLTWDVLEDDADGRKELTVKVVLQEI